jgi:serine/threonine-protein kinase
MADTLADDERWLARFKREAAAAAALSHPHIVKVFDFGIEEHRPYLVMAHVPAAACATASATAASCPTPSGSPASCCRRSRTCTRPGSSTATSSPGNILLDEHDRSQLTDFGIARPQDARR